MNLNNETKIGLIVFVGLGILLGLTIKSGNFSFKNDGYRIQAVFEDIDGVKLNSPVLFNGLEVGAVENITIREDNDKTRMVLTLRLKRQARLHADVKVSVKNLGFMGEKYVALTGGTNSLALLGDGSEIQGQSPADFNQILSDGKQLIGHVNEIALNVNERLKKNESNIDTIMTNFNTTSRNFQTISGNLTEMSADLKGHPWKLFFRGNEK